MMEESNTRSKIILYQIKKYGLELVKKNGIDIENIKENRLIGEYNE